MFVIIAQAGFDYTSFSSTEIFPSESSNGAVRCVNILISDDNALEENQNFTVSLTTLDSSVLLETTAAVISIVDDDGLLEYCWKSNS